MSEDEGFLARWSRRKQQAAEAAPVAPPSPGTEERNADAAAPDAEATPAVDLSKLPPLESITAGTDIREFLVAGVPEALKRAALRRAWAADPSIRDFVGLSENAWDFTAPDSMHGFGPMLPTDDVASMVARITRNVELPELCEADDAAAKLESSAQKSSSAEGRPPPAITTQSHILDESNPPVSSVSSAPDSAGEQEAFEIAAQNDPEQDPQPARRGHGGAMPQ